MKVLWFTNTPAIASEKLKSVITVGGWLYALGNEVKKRKEIELAIAFYHNQKISSFKEDGVCFYPIFKSAGKRIDRLKRKFIETGNDKDDVESFKNIVEDFQPDLIHIHGTELAFIRVLKFCHTPAVVSIQGNITVYKHFYFRGIARAKMPKYMFKNFRIKHSPFYRDYHSFIKKSKREKELFDKFRYIIGRTVWDRNIFRIFAPEARYFHNDEILREEFYREQWSRNINKTAVLTLYTTTTDLFYKGFETIVQTAMLLQKHKYFEFKWKIGGLSDDAEIVKLLKKRYKNAFPINKFELLGRLTASSILQEMLNSDIYVLPSHIENSPNSLCEAMIVGIPCIATHAGGTNSLLKDGEEGLLIQDGDPWSMAGAISFLFENKEVAYKMGIKARKRALHRHDPIKITNELMEIYSLILKDNIENKAEN